MLCIKFPLGVCTKWPISIIRYICSFDTIEVWKILTKMATEGVINLNVLALICTVVLSCNVVILVLYLTFPLMREVWLSAKPGSTHRFNLKCPVQSQENGSCYLMVRFCVLHIIVSVVSLFSSYIWCLSLSLSW